MYKKSPAQKILITIAILAIAFTSYHFQQQHQLERDKSKTSLGINVEVEHVRRGSLTRSIEVVGVLEASNTVVLKSQIRGMVKEVFYKGGEEVKKGDKIFALDDRTYRAAFKEAKALHVMAKFQYQRAQKLDEKKFTSQSNLDKVKSEFLRAEAGLEKAQKDLEDTIITAPYEGIISLHKISIGTLVSPEIDLLKITDIDPIKVDFKVPAKFFSYLNVGQTVELIVESVPNQVFEGNIEAIDAQVDTSAQQIAARVVLSNEKRLLKPGLLGRVKIIVGSEDNSLIVSAEAIESNGDQSYVYKVIEHPEQPGTYVVFRVPVLIGIQEGERIEVTRGINENDIIVTVGQQRLKDGYPVKFDKSFIQNDKSDANTEKPVKVQLKHLSGHPKNLSWWQRVKDRFATLLKTPPQEKNKSEFRKDLYANESAATTSQQKIKNKRVFKTSDNDGSFHTPTPLTDRETTNDKKENNDINNQEQLTESKKEYSDNKQDQISSNHKKIS